MNLRDFEVEFMRSSRGGGISSTIYFDEVLRDFSK